MVTMITRFISERVAFLLNDDRIQFFGINGKCCTDKLFTNYYLDIFPVSGDVKLNCFGSQQLKGELFLKTMNNFFHNTEGGSELRIGNFCRYVNDYTEEIRAEKCKHSMTLAVVFLWNPPEDLKEVPTANPARRRAHQ